MSYLLISSEIHLVEVEDEEEEEHAVAKVYGKGRHVTSLYSVLQVIRSVRKKSA